jgi:hypothetical protein
MSIEKMMCLSTAHITPDIAKQLDHMGYDDTIIYPHGEHGWLFVVPEEIAERGALPKELADCLDHAVRNGCHWLLIDQDAEIIDGLSTYDW